MKSKLIEKSNKNKIDLESLTNFLLQKGDYELDFLLQLYECKEINNSLDLKLPEVQDFYARVIENDFNLDISLDLKLPEVQDFYIKLLRNDINLEIPIDLFKSKNFIKKLISTSYVFLRRIPDKYKTYEICKIGVTQSGIALKDTPLDYITYELADIALNTHVGTAIQYIPEYLLDYHLCEKAVSQSSGTLRFVPKTIENYYDIVKIAFKDNRDIINNSWFSKEYIPQLIKDFPEDKDYINKHYSLKEYISKEVKKLLKETLFK